MAVNITATRNSTLFNDQDGDGIFDPGDVILTRIRITNSGTDPATGISVTDTLSGVTLVPGSVQVTPIAYDDAFNLTGNTPITISSAQGLLLNDVDPDGVGGSAGITVTSVDTTGTQGTVAFNADGSFTFTPTTGFVGLTSFKYYVQDAQGLGNVTEGIVTMTVSGLVWYVDNNYAGENGTADGSYMRPFTDLRPLNDNGTGAGGTPGTADGIIGDDDVDGAGSTIFVYHNAGNYTAGIALETGQTLRGDGVNYVVNGHNIGGTERTGGVDNVTTNAVVSVTTGAAVMLSTDNTVRGLTFDANGVNAVGMADGNGSVTTAAGTLNVSNVSFTGTGQAVDIDQGGNLNVAIDSLTSTGSTAQGVQLSGTASSGTGLISGAFTVTGGNIQGAASHDFLIGGAGPSSGGTVAVTYGGTLNGSTAGSALNINDRISGAGDINFTGNIAQTSTAANTGAVIFISNVASGDINITGTKTIAINGGSQNAIQVSSQTGGTIDFTGGAIDVDFATGTTGSAFLVGNQGGGSVTVTTAADIDFAGTASGGGVAVTSTIGAPAGSVNFTGGNLTITTVSGDGINFTNTSQGTAQLNISGAGNTVNTATGQIVQVSNGTTTGMTFGGLTSTGATVGNAIDINNLDGGTFTTGGTSIANTNAGSDAINVRGTSTTNFAFNGTTDINGTGSGGDGVELNGANGTVTFNNLTIDGVTGSGNGLIVIGATAAVTVTGGSIGNGVNTGDAFNVTNGTGAVTMGANISKNTAGNAVDISGHATGAISVTGSVTSTSGSNGISLVNNTSGNIGFTGDVSLNTGGAAALTFTNTAGTGANVTFSGGTTDIVTTGGTGINATNSTVGAGSLTITGASNTVAATTGRAINVDGVTLNATFLSVGVSGGGTTTGVFLKNTGSGGQFVVTGTGTTAGSGGTIANIGGGDMASSGAAATAGTGLYMENVSNVSLANMIFGANAGTMSNFGIRGENVNNFTLTDSEFRGTFGDNIARDEDTIRFGTGSVSTGLSGTAVFQGNNIQGGRENNLSVYVYGNNTLNMTIRDTVGGDQAVFGHNNGADANHSVLIESGGTAGNNLTLTVNGADFTGANGSLLNVGVVGTSATQNISILNNTFHNGQATAITGNAGVNISGALAGSTVNYNITDNSFKGTTGSSIYSMFNGSSGTVNGIVHSNDFGTNNGVVDNSQANYGSLFGGAFFGGIDSKAVGNGTINYALRISDNTIRDSGSGGVILIRSAAQDLQGVARVELTMTGNNIDEARPSIAGGLYLQVAGTGSGGRIGVNMSNNVIDVDNATSADSVVVDNGNSVNGHVYFPGYGGPAAPFTELSTFLTSAPRNNVFPAGSRDTGTGGAYVNPGGTMNGDAFVLTVPMMAFISDVIGNGWQDFEISPVTAPPRDPDPVPDTGGGGQTTGQGGETSEPANDGGTGGGGGTSGGGTGTGSSGGGTAPVVTYLTEAALESMVEAAIQRWIDAGASAEQVAAMRAVDFSVVDMAGIYLGASTNGVVQIDSDGAGLGWFVDSTPGDDGEFSGSGTRLVAEAGGPAAGRLDLLTVVMHELGHQIGLGDHYDRNNTDDLMYGYANAGERRLPADGDADGAIPGSIGSTAFALTPVSVGTLPGLKAVDVYFKATINTQTDKFITNLNNDSTISGGNFTTVVVNEINALDSLTLGSNVYLDADLDDLYDAGEGVVGVALELYADTNDSGGWDAGDVLLGSTTTIANGAYSFAGLAPGDYIVVITAANFGSGGALEDLLIVTNTVADPDNNVDNDNNGVAATGGAVASQTITLSYNNEGPSFTPGPGVVGEDTNNTLDFGFYANQPPVAGDDNVTVDEDSGPNDLSAQLLANDTDPESDTRTITSATQGSFGSTSVVAGVLTYTPNGNYNGSDSFTYTIDDGQGNQDTATVNVTVTAVNDPVTGTVPATAGVNEDSVDAAITGMSISDVDAALAPAGVYEVTLSATQGTLTLTTTTGLTFTTGDGAIDTSMTFHGTLADINTALATAKYTPDGDYNGSAQIDLEVTDDYGGIVATGTGTATSDSDTIAVTVNSVNDEPAGTDDSAAPVEGATYTFLTTDFSDGFSDPIDGDAFGGVKITTLPPGASGVIELNGNPIAAGDVITKAELDNGDLTFVAAAATGGTSPTFTFQVQDDGGNSNGGVEFDQSPNTFTLNIAFANFAPVVDLDADDSSGSTGGDYDTSFTEGGAAVAVTDTDVSITDADAGDNITGATISISNPATGDSLTVSGALPGSIIASGSGTDTLTLSGTGTRAEYEQALEMIRYANTGDDPTVDGTNMSRDIGITVTDGVTPSAPRTTTIAITAVNDPPAGTDNTLTATEDVPLALHTANFDFSDPDSGDAIGGVIITGVTGGKLFFDADGAGGADPVEVTSFPTAEYSAADVDAGKLTFLANPNLNGTGVGTIGFQVVDDSGAVNDTDPSANTLTIDVTPINDTPVVPNSPGIAVNEQTTITINSAITVSDVDLDARNGGSGDYGGASFVINRDVSNADDLFNFDVTGALFTVNGNDLEAGGQVFATFTQSGGILNISFTSTETIATTALVNDVLRHLQYTNLSNDPPASVTLLYGLDDGAPDAVQGALGAPFNNFDGGQVVVTLNAVNDAPVNSLGGTIGTGEDAVDAWLSGMSISDPDADPATDKIFVNFFVDNGSLEIRTDVVGGITAGDIVAQSSETISVLATQDQINATLAASNGLTYTPDLNFNGDDTLTVTTNDMGFTGADPGLTGDGTSEADVDTRTISVSAVEDPADAVDDSNSVNENATITGASVTGNDSDPDGPALEIEEVNGAALQDGVEITLASGAKLTVNADGTYSYNPNGKFNTLTSTSTGQTGAKNTSATDSFTYKLVNGDTATVTITVNGVASAQDRLEGDSGDDTITGTPNTDLFYLVQGGNDNVSGLGSGDIFYFGATYDSGDTVDGGGGVDILGLQGDYSVNHILGDLTSVESISLLSGSNTILGDTAGNLYDYYLTASDANVAAGAIMKVNGGNLLAGEDLFFDGSLESDGSYLIYGGFGQDSLFGGSGNDVFVYAQGRFALTDQVSGGGGYDSLFLRGDYTIDFTGSSSLQGIENITLASSSDGRYASGGTDFDYEIIWEDNLLAGGQTMTVNGGGLGFGESMIFNGIDETNGFLKLYAGNGNDVLTGGSNADLLFGGGSGDTLTGGGGNDVFTYFFLTDSNSTERDGIQDFTLGDKINLSKIDAMTGGGGNDAFTFIGNAAFSNVQGQLRFENISLGGPIWLIQGDVNGDSVSDFELVLVISDSDPITASDFFL
ncbi:MAG TPA: tandem-95 repeat protein [Allosphingosinicella sp.]